MKKALIIILVILSIFSFVRHQRRAPKRNFSDFHIYYVTGRRILNKQDIYIPEDQEHAEFKYSSLFALFMVPFALFPERAADALWYLLQFSLLFFIFASAKELVCSNSLVGKKLYLFYALSFLVMARFIFLNLDLGQPNILMLALLLLGFRYYLRKDDLACGLLIGLAVMVKYTPLLIIPYFLYKKRIRLALLILLSVVLFSFASGALLRALDPNVTSLKLTEQISYLKRSCLNPETLIMDYKNQSLLRYIYVFFSSTTYGIEFFKFSRGLVTAFIALIVFVLYAFMLVPLRSKDTLNLSLLVSYIAFLNPNGWLHGYIFLILAYMSCIYYLIKVNFKDRVVLILLSVAFIFHSFTSSSVLEGIFGKGLYLAGYAQRPVSMADLYGWVTLATIPLIAALLLIKQKGRSFC
ncbi:glycosyltransferase family 87 protein [Candidatus Omnitrophota bacterium]